MAYFASFVQTIFGGAWQLFETPVPGFPFSYADLILALLIASGGLFILKTALGLGSNPSSGVSSFGRSSQNPKISKERRNDEK